MEEPHLLSKLGLLLLLLSKLSLLSLPLPGCLLRKNRSKLCVVLLIQVPWHCESTCLLAITQFPDHYQLITPWHMLSLSQPISLHAMHTNWVLRVQPYGQKQVLE